MLRETCLGNAMFPITRLVNHMDVIGDDVSQLPDKAIYGLEIIYSL